MSESTYLCYDLKGIQSFIFAVPRLKYICGGSAIIDQFDRSIEQTISVDGATFIFAGGGKGAFHCTSAAVADHVQQLLVAEATRKGLGICFGRDADYAEAAQLADQTYPWLPSDDEMDGVPCLASGLYPVEDKKPHWVIQMRDAGDKENRVSRRFERDLLTGLDSEWAKGAKIEFMHNVSIDDDQDPSGAWGCRALGARNRWAIIAMDGNDMGTQHKAGLKEHPDSASFTAWLKRMSKALDDCSRGACQHAMEHILQNWAKSDAGQEHVQECIEDNDGVVVLPFRPLIVGGDDIVVICHVSYAMEFVQTAAKEFNRLSKEKAAQHPGLWPATNDELTISAGVLFTPVTMPLATAVGYTESLMASAKKKGRDHQQEGQPSPACIDWETITEGLLDTPAARRQREFIFDDKDTSETIELTCRPYLLADLPELLQLSKRYEEIPGTIRYQVLPGLRQSYWDRQVFVARLGKKRALKGLVEDLLEERAPKAANNRWQQAERNDKKIRCTGVVDALLLLEETARMTKQTAEEN